MRYILKDIAKVQPPGIIAHGVNCQNVMGSGVAKALYTQWPEVKSEYHQWGSMILGDAQFIEVEPGLVVANCFTQEEYGRDGRRYASTRAIRDSMELVAARAHQLEIYQIHIPKIGCGLGGLDWKGEVEPLLLETEENLSVTFVVCEVTLHVPGKKEQ